MNDFELIRPDYTIYKYTDQIYKIVRFKNTVGRISPPVRSKSDNTEKFDTAFSRARNVVLQLALCNEWKYFATFTIDKKKYDRFDLDGFFRKFSQWLRDYRKKYPFLTFRYLLVPEQHQDGAWHLHGLFTDISPVLIPFHCFVKMGGEAPERLVAGSYFNWVDYMHKFGFCSFGKLQDPVAAAFYVTKYIGKSISDSVIPVGSHLYYCSQGLNRASKQGEVYGRTSYLDQFLHNTYDFCETGFTACDDSLDWSFGLEYMDYDLLQAFSYDSPSESKEDVFSYMQVGMEEFV